MDAIEVLAYLFAGAPTTCRDALDTNDDGALDVADAVYLLAYLFAGGPPPARRRAFPPVACVTPSARPVPSRRGSLTITYVRILAIVDIGSLLPLGPPRG